jgi:tetraacyldisaccharide 4'-kinase
MSSRGQDLWRRVASDAPGPWWLGPLRAGAGVASGLYGAGVWLNNTAFDLGLKKTRRLPVPLIGVGNLAVGGAGKTPLVMEIVAALGRLGLPAGVISRGYGRSGKQDVVWVCDGNNIMAEVDQAGDEPLLMARRLKVPLAVGADRYQVGRELLDRAGPRVLVADDLYQHRALHRDLNILCLDAEDPFQGGRLLPRGSLRESAQALERADAVVLTRAQDRAALEAAGRLLAWRLQDRPLLACGYVVKELMDLQGEVMDQGRLDGLKVAGFCGLARPGSFRQSLEGLCLELVGFEAFGDHHRFTPSELEGLWQRAKDAGAWALVCSEKDAVRLPLDLASEMVILQTRLELEFWGGHVVLDNFLRRSLAAWGGGA